MVFGGLGGAGSTPNSVSAALAASDVQRARAGGRVPDNVVAAARDARALRRRKRRIRWWSRIRLIR